MNRYTASTAASNFNKFIIITLKLVAHVIYYENCCILLETRTFGSVFAACRPTGERDAVCRQVAGRPDLARLFLLQIDFRLWI